MSFVRQRVAESRLDTLKDTLQHALRQNIGAIRKKERWFGASMDLVIAAAWVSRVTLFCYKGKIKPRWLMLYYVLLQFKPWLDDCRPLIYCSTHYIYIGELVTRTNKILSFSNCVMLKRFPSFNFIQLKQPINKLTRINCALLGWRYICLSQQVCMPRWIYKQLFLWN